MLAETEKDSSVRLRPASTIAGFGGRAAALIMLIAFSIPAALTALSVWATLGRPIMFRQVRSGLHGQNFTVIKFRTMNDRRDSAGCLLPDSERETRVTRLVRRLRLDEIPQLLLILIGHMSFIGPRPLLPVTVSTFGHWGVMRGRTRPGLTGWAQVNGGTKLTNIQKLALDLWYIENRTPLIDFWLLVLTVNMLLRGERVREKPLALAQAFLVDRSREVTSKGGRPSKRQQMRIALAGPPHLLARARDALIEDGYEASRVLSIPVDSQDWPDPETTISTGLEYSTTLGAGAAEIGEAEFASLVVEFDPDILLLLDRPQLFSPCVGSIPNLRTIGFHPSSLPLMRGRCAVSHAVLENLPATGATLHWIERADDTGPLLMQTQISLDRGETIESLWRKQSDTLASMLPSALELIHSGNPPRIEQDNQLATYCGDLQIKDRRIDWTASADEILRNVSMYADTPSGIYGEIGGNSHRIAKARFSPVEGEASSEPGMVIRETPDGYIVTCGDGKCIRVMPWCRHGERSWRETSSYHSALEGGA
ncbi:hypothetical protein GR183_21215 [Stappia sp. GBMRC 2046]|uniref:Sugar transferase involved in LPS biosynthesis (Colanic, teichoic acid) n=1 Tax=Stappia sediminis TaxID=2692190 RepID=A0A7X3LYH5_9HYPH|nr:sugar transferase [Stappia sediminis]MXN67435.1 hypothetical protein [Stappia sediminis]